MPGGAIQSDSCEQNSGTGRIRLKHVGDALDRNRLCLGYFGENSMESASFQWVMEWNCNVMDRRPFMNEPYVASLLPSRDVAEMPQGADQPVCRNPARQLHAASTAINSSLTKCNWMSLGRSVASSK